jgi:CheY-like chemotaxis protein
MKALVIPKNILLVDDDQDLREIVTLALNSVGYQVLTANDGLQALEMLRGGTTPQMILLDLWMPGLDGWGVLEKLREDKVLDAIPVVVFSAGGDSARSAGGLSFLPKPLDLDDLLNTVRKFCGEPTDLAS